LWRTLRRWYEQYWFEIVVGLTLLLIAAVVVLFLVVLIRHG
jgi:uncharacterized membrane protein